MISTAPPFVLRLSKDERGVFSRIDNCVRMIHSLIAEYLLEQRL